jgi:general stress protein 26
MAKVKATSRPPKVTRPHMPGYGLPKTKKGLLPWKWAEQRLNKSRQYWIATTRPDGRPHVMVIWALWMDGLLYFSTGKETVKARNLKGNPNCTMCTDDSAEAVILEGVVERQNDVETIGKFWRTYSKKYKFDTSSTNGDSSPVEEPVLYLRPKVAFGLWEKKFAPTATKWVFEGKQ